MHTVLRPLPFCLVTWRPGMSFTLRDDAYSEPYDPPQYCNTRGCGILWDDHTKPEDHDRNCPQHPDYPHHLDELDEADAMQTAMVRVPERDRVA